MEDLKARGNVYLLLSIITAVGVWNIANGTQVKASSKRSVYRLYNSNVKGGDHYYTLSKYEAKTLVNLGWRWDNNANPVFYSTGTVIFMFLIILMLSQVPITIQQIYLSRIVYYL